MEDAVTHRTNIAARALYRGWGNGRRTFGVFVTDVAVAGWLRREGR